MAKKAKTKKITKKVSSKKATKKVTKKVAKKKATKKVAPKKATKKVIKKVTKKAVPKKATKKVVKKSVAVQTAPLVKLEVGQMAPEFNLVDQNGNSIKLTDFRGKRVVVYFYPKAMTPGCTVQACSLRDSKTALSEQNIIVLGISPDPVKSLKKFEEKEHLNFTLLSDTDHKVAEAYGSWGLKQFMGREFMGVLRQSFLVDREGKIVHIMNKVDTKTHHDDVLNAFKGLE